MYFLISTAREQTLKTLYSAQQHISGVFKSTDAEISYFVKWDKDGVARDQLGASFKQYLLNSVKVYANARFDLASETFSEVLVGAKYYPSSALVFTGEWYQSYPTFDNTSIYAVFAVDRYQEGRVPCRLYDQRQDIGQCRIQQTEL